LSVYPFRDCLQETELQQARAKALRFLDSISSNLESTSEYEYIERCVGAVGPGEPHRRTLTLGSPWTRGGDGCDGGGHDGSVPSGRVVCVRRSIRESISSVQHSMETLKKQCEDLEADEKALESKVRNPAPRHALLPVALIPQAERPGSRSFDRVLRRECHFMVAHGDSCDADQEAADGPGEEREAPQEPPDRPVRTWYKRKVPLHAPT
jgi:hypothetical protein